VETVGLGSLRGGADRSDNSVWDEEGGCGLPRRIPRLKSWKSRGRLGAVVLLEKKWESKRGEKRNEWKEEESPGISFVLMQSGGNQVRLQEV